MDDSYRQDDRTVEEGSDTSATIDPALLQATPSSNAAQTPPLSRQSEVARLHTIVSCIEDSDDPSWDDEDHEGTFSASIQGKLAAMADHPDSFLLTIPLRRHQRRVVHATAHTKRLSHLRVDSNGQKRVLVCNRPISSCDGSRKPYNFFTGAARVPFLQPNVVVMHFNCTRGTMYDKLYAWLEDLGIPRPVEWRLFPSENYNSVLLAFDCPGPAATLMTTLLPAPSVATEFQLCSVKYQLKTMDCSPENVYSSTSRGEIFGSSQVDAEESFRKYELYHSFLTRAQGHFDFTNGDESSGGSSGTSSGYSSLSMDADYSLTPSGRKKRRREPRVIQGYTCVESKCGKTFDTAGELNKHNQFHMPKESYPYRCERCQKAFLYPKDLRRHQGTQAHAEQDDVKGLNGVDRALYGEIADDNMTSALGDLIFAKE